MLNVAWLIVFAQAQVDASPTKAVPNDHLVQVVLPKGVHGYYVPLREGEPKHFTRKQAERQPRTPQENRTAPLRGIVEYDKRYGVSIVLSSHAHGTASEKLLALGDVPPEDVRCLIFFGDPYAAAVESIGRFRRLKELMIQASEAWEDEENAKKLAGLAELEQLSVTSLETQRDFHTPIFGSTAFCRAMLKLKRLRSLSMLSDKLTDKDVAILASHPSLESLFLHTNKPLFGSRSLEALQKTANLRELEIQCTDDITDTDVMGFAEKHKLELLGILTQAPITCLDRVRARLCSWVGMRTHRRPNPLHPSPLQSLRPRNSRLRSSVQSDSARWTWPCGIPQNLKS